MPDQPLSRPFVKALAAFNGVPDPLDRLAAVHSAREALESLEQATVVEARAAGATWVEIGMLFGVSKQAAQQRFRHPGDPARGQATAPEAAPSGKAPKTKPAKRSSAAQ